MNQVVFERYLTRDEERQLLRTVARFADVYSRRDLQVMHLLRHSGGRIGSVLALTVGDALEAIKSKRLQFRTAKAGRVYDVHCNSRTRAAMRTLLKIRREMGHAPAIDEPLIMGRKHAVLAKRTFEARLKMWRERAGLVVKVTPHYFRHTLAQRLIETSQSQDPLGIVQAALGHRSRNSTAIYARPSREQVASAIDAAG